jgi:predicted TIM-barrel fold metal-dependent hydrolase
MSAVPATNLTAAAVSALAPAREAEYNRLKLDYRQPMSRPAVRGLVIDFHTHLLAARHAKVWFEAARHYGIDAFVTMCQLEEVLGLQRDWPGKIHFIAIPQWQTVTIEDWLRRLEMFYNLGSRIIKFHMAPGTMASRKIRLDSPVLRPVIREAAARGMMLMSHIGDPETWYTGKYTDIAKFGTREDHYKMWESVLEEYRGHPWLGAHMGGNPENLERLQSLLDRFPDLNLDCSATRWMVREISARRDEARKFIIRNADRIVFGTDQVSGDDRGFDFLASRFWSHRKLWETDYVGPCPILDPDVPADKQPEMRGLALPADVLQKIYHDNGVRLLARLGTSLQ